MKQPKYKPGDELRYMGNQNVLVNYWDENANEYWCYSYAWKMDIHCQEKDLKPIEEKTNE